MYTLYTQFMAFQMSHWCEGTQDVKRGTRTGHLEYFKVVNKISLKSGSVIVLFWTVLFLRQAIHEVSPMLFQQESGAGTPTFLVLFSVPMNFLVSVIIHVPVNLSGNWSSSPHTSSGVFCRIVCVLEHSLVLIVVFYNKLNFNNKQYSSVYYKSA